MLWIIVTPVGFELAQKLCMVTKKSFARSNFRSWVTRGTQKSSYMFENDILRHRSIIDMLITAPSPYKLANKRTKSQIIKGHDRRRSQQHFRAPINSATRRARLYDIAVIGITSLPYARLLRLTTFKFH